MLGIRLERLSDFDFEVKNRPGQLRGNTDGLSHLAWESATLVDQDEDALDAVLIHSVNVEPLPRESIRAALKQDPVLSQVVDWLKTGVRQARRDVEGGGRKLLSYWSRRGRLLLKDGLVLRSREN